MCSSMISSSTQKAAIDHLLCNMLSGRNLARNKTCMFSRGLRSKYATVTH